MGRQRGGKGRWREGGWVYSDKMYSFYFMVVMRSWSNLGTITQPITCSISSKCKCFSVSQTLKKARMATIVGVANSHTTNVTFGFIKAWMHSSTSLVSYVHCHYYWGFHSWMFFISLFLDFCNQTFFSSKKTGLVSRCLTG